MTRRRSRDCSGLDRNTSRMPCMGVLGSREPISRTFPIADAFAITRGTWPESTTRLASFTGLVTRATGCALVLMVAANACEHKAKARQNMAINKAVRERRTVVINIPLFLLWRYF